MPSSKDDGTAAAAGQIGSLSLGELAERKDDEPEPNGAENGTQKMCSACEKKSDVAKKCTACKCVWYCDKDCQNKHWKEHKKECKWIKKVLDERGGKLDVGTEKDIAPLGNVPPSEECPICMHAFPHHEMLKGYYACCGKTVCGGCNFQHWTKSGKTCPYCRTTIPKSGEKELVRMRKRAERKDPDAMRNMSECYRVGHYGLPVDQTKCIDFLRQSAALGCLAAQYQLGIFHENGAMGLEQDRKEALKYYTNAAEGGHVFSRHNVGSYED